MVNRDWYQYYVLKTKCMKTFQNLVHCGISMHQINIDRKH